MFVWNDQIYTSPVGSLFFFSLRIKFSCDLKHYTTSPFNSSGIDNLCILYFVHVVVKQYYNTLKAMT